MGKILDKVLGVRSGSDRTTRRPDGSTLGLTTPATLRGNTVYGPAGGRATKFATTSPTTGFVSNKQNVTASDWKASPSAPKKSMMSTQGGGGGRPSGGNTTKTTNGAKPKSFSGTRSGDVAGPRKDSSGRNVSSAKSPTKKRSGGLILSGGRVKNVNNHRKTIK